MDQDHKDLLRRLFVVATERLETAHDVAVAGQSAGLDDDEAARAARELQLAADDIARLTGAMAALLGRSARGNQGDPKS